MKKTGFLATYKDHLQFDEQDVCIIISTSANNPVPIDMATYAKEAGALTISLQSLEYQHQPSRHPSGKRLEQVVDEVLNTHVPLGDGVLTVDQLQYAPVSTVLGATLLNALFAQIIELMHAQGASVPVFGSSNLGKIITMRSLISMVSVFISRIQRRICGESKKIFLNG